MKSLHKLWRWLWDKDAATYTSVLPVPGSVPIYVPAVSMYCVTCGFDVSTGEACACNTIGSFKSEYGDEWGD